MCVGGFPGFLPPGIFPGDKKGLEWFGGPSLKQ